MTDSDLIRTFLESVDGVKRHRTYRLCDNQIEFCEDSTDLFETWTRLPTKVPVTREWLLEHTPWKT